MSTETLTSVAHVEKDKHTNWLTKYSMLIYGILAYGLSWGIGFGAFAALQNGRLDPDGTLASVLGQIAAASPALAALIVIAATRGRQGIVDLLHSLVKWRVGLQWYSFALLGMPILLLSAYSIIYGAPLFQALMQQWTILFTKFLPAIAFTFLTTGLAEEPGWRGFALPGIQAKYGALLGSLILGVFWAFWHVPNIILWETPLIFALLQLVAVMINTFVHTWIYNKTQGSVFISMLFHAAGNVTPGFVSFLAGINGVTFKSQSYTAGLISTSVLVLAVILLTRGRLGYRSAEEMGSVSRTLDEQAPV
jgi:membrane protease YdiL (CAAX protease family)